ncbi:DUF3060 domain-containing protein [Nocardioides sp. CGMCC 1.13656]|nr:MULTISPECIES: DUF3060 domain-containing protein [unclassified Nocardioides]MBA2952428.1 DUF3060 domain-containing protein [Nocardioides sp. CGMCC 1.13656]
MTRPCRSANQVPARAVQLTLAAVLVVGLLGSAASGSAPSPLGASARAVVTCYEGEVLYLTGSADVSVGVANTRCGRVVLAGDNATVTLPETTQLDVTGSGNTVIGTGAGLGVIHLEGDDSTVRATRISGVYITGDGNRATAQRGGFAGAHGRQNVLRYGRLETMALRGDRNDGRAATCGATRVQGDRNKVVHGRLKVLLLSGNRNLVTVADGRVRVAASGTGNVLRLRRR